MTVIPELHVGSCPQCLKPVNRESFFVTTWPKQPERPVHLSCAPRVLSLNASAKANCMRCGQSLDAASVSIVVVSKTCRVHARCRDAFLKAPPADAVPALEG